MDSDQKVETVANDGPITQDTIRDVADDFAINEEDFQSDDQDKNGENLRAEDQVA